VKNTVGRIMAGAAALALNAGAAAAQSVKDFPEVVDTSFVQAHGHKVLPIARGGWVASLVGGLLSGGVCAFLGIGDSVFLGDAPPSLLAFGTAGSAVAGLIGGAAGKATAPRPTVTG
jgi:hypothetical protein